MVNMRTLIIFFLLFAPSALAVPLPDSGPWKSEAYYFETISGMAYHGCLVVIDDGSHQWFYRNGTKCRF